MIIKTLPIGEYDSNIYVLMDEKSKELALIDCGAEYYRIKSSIDELGGNLKYILLTHGHNDHTLGVKSVKKVCDCICVISEKEKKSLGNFNFMNQIPVDEYVKDGDILKLGSLEISVIETPGHTLGGVCYLVSDALFSGDTLFKRSVGRWDLQGGDQDTLLKSIREKLFTLNDDIKVYPGHEDSTTIGYEKKFNFYA
ncbi:MAG: MBL fold metallo-hydrolase [Oscillospiraceae bacterium]|nr:MBL fold metallo-hydrolase [Oscillospiraceae bacterium]